jgi:hypothetical protein
MKKIFSLLLMLALCVGIASAQAVDFTTTGTTSGALSVVCTNTATVTLSTPAIKIAVPAYSTTIQVVVTKTSGTVGGTITLLGSTDGVNYKAINTMETQTPLATVTPADATAAYHWRLSYCPFNYYRVSYTGAATMVASISANLIRSLAAD